MMKKFMKFLHSKKSTVVLAAVALALLLGSAVGSTNAALTYYSEYYTARVSLYDIGVTLVENGNDVSWRDYIEESASWKEHTGDLLTNMLEETNGKLLLNTPYTEELSVKNSGNIDTYVRMRVYRYWTDANGKKTAAIDPDLIKLNVVQDSGWILGETTDERMYFYWPEVLSHEEDKNTTTAVIDKITIDGAISKNVTTVKNADGSWKTTYDYNGYKFVLEAEVDAVQTHNYKAAIKSSWGVDADAIGIKGGE